MIGWIVELLHLAPRDPDLAAKRFNRFSSAAGDRVRPWLYGLIGFAVVLLLAAVAVLALA